MRKVVRICVDIPLLLKNLNIFWQRLEKICSEAARIDGDNYRLGEQDIRYVRVRSYQEEHKTLGILVDVDNLMQMNDNWGHEYGDRLLENVAQILKGYQAPYRLTARLSDDEFAMLMHCLESREEREQL